MYNNEQETIKNEYVGLLQPVVSPGEGELYQHFIII